MAYGFLAKNANNSILVSDKTYNTEFIGKATFVKRYNSNSGIYLYPGGADITQTANIHEFTINSGGRVVLPFIYSPGNYFVSIVNIRYSGNICTLQILAQTTQQPTIYCFAKATSSFKSGWGMNVYDANGNTAFSTQSNILIIDSIYNAYTQNSSLYYTGYVSKYSITVGTRNRSPAYTAPFATSGNSIAKAAILYSTYATASVYRSSNGDGHYFESGAKFDYSTKQLATWWLDLGFYSTYNSDAPARDEIAIVIDGALYD